MKTRRGVSLIEALIVISTMSVVATLGATMVFFLMRAEGRSTRHFLMNRTISRLADRFRRDANTALDVEVLVDANGTPNRIRLAQHDRQIVFQSDDERVIRLVEREEKVLSRETYRLADSAVLFEVIENGQLAAVVIRHDRSASNIQTRGLGAVSEFRIESAVGRAPGGTLRKRDSQESIDRE